MKRFWVFVIICVVALGVGFTIFRFMSKDELIYVKRTVFEVNSGEIVDPGIVHENAKSGTIITATENSNGTILQKDGDKFIARNGGTTTITITSNKENFMPVTVQVTVGDGMLTTPYFIRNEKELSEIGKDLGEGKGVVYALSKNYKLVSSFALQNPSWVAIGADNDAGFTGTFDFNGHQISNLNVTTTSNGYASLFAKIGNGGYIKGANIKDVTLSADADYSGALAGINLGRIENATISNINVTNAKENAMVGGIVGKNSGIITKSVVVNNTTAKIVATGNGSIAGGIAGASKLTTLDNTVSITRSSAKTSVSALKSVGGLVGENSGAVIENCYAGAENVAYTISASNTTNAGGIAGLVEYNDELNSTHVVSYVADTYSVMLFANTNSNYVGQIIGQLKNSADESKPKNVVYGNYYSSEVNTGLAGVQKSDIDGVNPKATANLKKEATYAYTAKTPSGNQEWKWQFEEGVWVIGEDVTLPELSFAVNYVTSRVQNFRRIGEIWDINDFKALANDDGTYTYTLMDDIVLTSSDFEPFDFNGKLICPLNADNVPAHKIKLTINTEDGVNGGAAALFKKLGQSAQLTNILVEVNINSIIGADHLAAIAAYNEGSLDNCSAIGTITTERSTSSVSMFIGGLVAENSGNLNNCVSNVALTYSRDPKVLYIGGLVGYNKNTIQKSTNKGGIVAEGNSEIYAGGITGYSTGAITSCANHGSIDGKIEASRCYVGGITAYLGSNSYAKITRCGSYGGLKGCNVGGIVGISLSGIEECYSSAQIQGVYIGGLAFNIKQGTADNRSYMKNCMTDGSLLNGQSSKAVVCGAVYQIDVSENHLAYCERIFSSCKFGGDGQYYYETASNIRGSNKIGSIAYYVDADAFNNSIHIERNQDIARSNGDFSWSWKNPLQWDMIGKGHADIQISDDQAKGSDDFAVFTQNNYSTDVWTYTKGQYPQLKNVAK